MVIFLDKLQLTNNFYILLLYRVVYTINSTFTKKRSEVEGLFVIILT